VPTLLLVRHGRTGANSSGVLAGWTPGVTLDETGRGQVQALAERVARAGICLTRIVSSPLERCHETAAVLAAGAAPGIPVEVDERLGECHYGAWTGRPIKELSEDPLWRVVQDQPSAARFPDGADFPGETMAAMQARVLHLVREVDAAVAEAAGPSAIWMAVSHGDVIKAVLSDAAGAHLDQFQRIQVDPASVSVVRYTDRRPFLLRSNDTGGELGHLVPPPEAEVPAGDATVGGGLGGPAGVG